MRTIILNTDCESHTDIMNKVAEVMEKNINVISANYDGDCINVHSINEDGEEECIAWYCDTIDYGDNDFVKSVNIDC